MMHGLPFIKPVSIMDQMLIDTVTKRFEGVEAPFMAFDRGDYIELLCAPTIRMTEARLATLKSQQASHATETVETREVCATPGVSNG